MADEFGKLVELGGLFGNNSSLGSGGNSAVQCEEAGLTPHNLDKKQSFVTRRRVAYFVDTLHNRIQRRVVAYCCVGAVEVVVDSAWQADNRQIEFDSKLASTRKRTVAAYHNESVDFMLLDGFVRLCTTFRAKKFLTTSSFQNGSTQLNNVGNAFVCKFHDFVVNQSAIAAVDSHNTESVEFCRTSHGTNCGVHPRSIAARSKNANCLYICHRICI